MSRAPAESTSQNTGTSCSSAYSVSRTIFSTVRAPHEPAFTVGSLAMTHTGRPSTVPTPVTTPSAGRSPASALASSAFSTNEPSSSSSASRSRTNSFPWRSSLARLLLEVALEGPLGGGADLVAHAGLTPRRALEVNRSLYRLVQDWAASVRSGAKILYRDARDRSGPGIVGDLCDSHGVLSITVAARRRTGRLQLRRRRGAQSAKPKADDVGITDTEIRLAVIADVDTPIQPGLFQKSVDAMEAWAEVVNKDGGIAGRKVVIDFIDSKLNPNETRNAIIKACADDFAMVGGQALFLSNVDDMVACTNKAGEAIGIPDMPGNALDNAQSCSPVTYVLNGLGSYCETKDDNPQTYTDAAG